MANDNAIDKHRRVFVYWVKTWDIVEGIRNTMIPHIPFETDDWHEAQEYTIAGMAGDTVCVVPVKALGTGRWIELPRDLGDALLAVHERRDVDALKQVNARIRAWRKEGE